MADGKKEGKEDEEDDKCNKCSLKCVLINTSNKTKYVNMTLCVYCPCPVPEQLYPLFKNCPCRNVYQGFVFGFPAMEEAEGGA
jgi:hypothetical protein